MGLYIFLSVVMIFLITFVQSQKNTCSDYSSRTGTVKFSIESYRAQSGQMKSIVSLKHSEATNNSLSTAPWKMDVVQNITTIGHDEDEVSIVAIITGPVQVKISKDYEFFPGVGYYKFHPYGAKWGDARKICTDEGAHLIIINSENEANVLKNIFVRFPKEKLTNAPNYSYCWVGVYEQGANGQYFTIFGDHLNTTGFKRWYPGKPSIAGTDECVFAERSSSGLHDFGCGSLAPFLCEF